MSEVIPFRGPPEGVAARSGGEALPDPGPDSACGVAPDPASNPGSDSAPPDPAVSARPGLAFDGAGLDRAAHLRGDPQALARLAADPAARFLAFWHGRPLLAAATARPDPVLGAGLCGLGAAAPLLAAARMAPVFLGLSQGVAVFAADVSPWRPDAAAPALGHLPDTAANAAPLSHPDLPAGAVFGELRAAMGGLDPRAAELAATARAVLGWHATHGFCAACGTASAVTLGGWQRLCPACGSRHFPRTDPVVIMRVTRGNAVLLGRSPGWPEGMFSCLAGFMEPGETAEAAVRREVAEETGVRVGAVRLLASQPWPFPASLMLGCAARAESATITPDPTEIEAALWVGRERLLGVFAGTDAQIRPPRPGSIAHWMLRGWLMDRAD